MALNNTPVDFEKLIEALEKFIPEILPKGQNVDVKKLAKETADFLQKFSEKSGNPLTVDKLANPEFVNQISMAVKLTSTIKSSPELTMGLEKIFSTLTGDLKNSDDKEKFNKFIMDVKDLVNKNDKKNMRHDFKALLSKHLIPEQHGKLLTLFEKFMNDMKKNTPEMKGEKKTEVDDPYVNLLGVLNSAFTGGYSVPQYQDMGNALAIPDMNPYNDNANIGRDNAVNFCWGDSFGKEGKSIDRMESLGSIFADALQEVGMHIGTSPTTPTSTKLKPPGNIE